MITTLTLNPAIDLTMEVNGITIEDVNRVQTFTEVPGGKGVNVSIVLNRFGYKPLNTLVALGGLRGERFKEDLREINLKFRSIDIKNETRVNLVLFDRVSKKTTKLNQLGPHISSKELNQLIDICKKNAKKSHYFVLSGSLLPNMRKGWYAQLIAKIQRSGLNIVVDADGDVLKNVLKMRPFLIKPNIHEAERVLGAKFRTESSYWNAAKWLQKKGAQNVLLSLGSKGACFLDAQGNQYRAHTIPINVKSTTGAGDSFLAGFLYQLSNKKSISESLKYGMACGTHTAMTAANDLCQKSSVEKIVKKIKIKKI